MDVEEFVVQSSSGQYSRRVWLSKGPQHESHPLCVILDGEFYVERMEILPILENLRQNPKVPNCSYLLVSHESAAARQTDFICDAQYSKYIAEDLVKWAKEQAPSIRDKEHILCGVSLSGLSSAYTTISYPEVFAYSLCQSGSFWWNHEWFEELIRSSSPMRARFWLSVGDKERAENVSHPPSLYQEMSQIAGVQKAAQLLEEHGAEIFYHVYSGGHEAGPWKEEFVKALEWLCITSHRG